MAVVPVNGNINVDPSGSVAVSVTLDNAGAAPNFVLQSTVRTVLGNGTLLPDIHNPEAFRSIADSSTLIGGRAVVIATVATHDTLPASTTVIVEFVQNGNTVFRDVQTVTVTNVETVAWDLNYV